MDCSKLTADHEHMDLMIDKLRAECSDTGMSGSHAGCLLGAGSRTARLLGGDYSTLSSAHNSTFDQMTTAGAASLCILHPVAAHGCCLHHGDCKGLLLQVVNPLCLDAEVVDARAKGQMLCELLQELQDCMLPHLALEEAMTAPDRMKGLFSEAEMRQLHP